LAEPSTPGEDAALKAEPPPAAIPTSRHILSNLRIVGISGLGGWACSLAGIPAPWLTGAMLASAVCVSALRWRGPSRPVADTAMLLCGLLLGSTATPEALQAAARYPGSLGMMVLAVIGIMVVTGGYLVQFARWPRMDALLAAAPGALSAVMAIAYERHIPLSRIAIIQLFRLFALVALLPSLVVYSGIAPADLRAPTAKIVSAGGLMVLGAAGIATAMLFERLRMTAPVILGATLASAVLHGGGWVEGTLPPEVAILGFVLLGSAMGGRFGAVTPGGLVSAMPVAFIAFATSMAVAMGLAWPAAWLAGVPYATAVVAFAPGGLEAMAVLAFALGLDPLYVGAHHLLRFFVVGFGLPLLIGWLARR
jgi:uncharacterized protein